MGEFVRPDWSLPLDLEDRLAKVPEAATVKGMFFSGPIDLAAKKTAKHVGRDRYVAFKDYPLTEHLEVLAQCAKLAYPREPARSALRRLGHDAYRTFVESLAGRALFAVAARSWEDGLTLVSRAYGITGPVGTGRVVEASASGAVIALRGIWNFPDSYHLGVFEGAISQYGKAGEIWVRVHGLADVDLQIRLNDA